MIQLISDDEGLNWGYSFEKIVSSSQSRNDLSNTGVARDHASPKFLAYLVILCFERRDPKQNTVARQKQTFWAGYTTAVEYFL